MVVAYHAADELERCLAALGGETRGHGGRQLELAGGAVGRSTARRDLCRSRAQPRLRGGRESRPARDHRRAATGRSPAQPRRGRHPARRARRSPTSCTVPGNERVAAVSPRLVDGDGALPARRMAVSDARRGRGREAVGLGRRLPDARDVRDRRGAAPPVGGDPRRRPLRRAVLPLRRGDRLAAARARARAGAPPCATSVVAEHRGAGTSQDPRRRETLFHAAQETYVRKWHGRARLARLSRCGVRRSDCPGGRCSQANGAPRPADGRASTSAARGAAPGSSRSSRLPSVVHVVTTGNFAGVERYVCNVARETAARGWDATVVGGSRGPDAGRARRRRSLAAGSTRRSRRCDRSRRVGPARRLPCAHDDGGGGRDRRAALPPGTDRQHASLRGTEREAAAPDALLAPHIATRLARQIAVSDYVARHLESPPDAVIRNGVPPSPCLWRTENRVVLVLQRLEQEKDTLTALRAWQAARSRIDEGWSMRVVGDGSERPTLEAWVASQRVPGVDVHRTGRPNVADEFAVGRHSARARHCRAVRPRRRRGDGRWRSRRRDCAAGGHLETVGLLPGAVMFPPGDARAAAAAMRSLVPDAVAGRGVRRRPSPRRKGSSRSRTTSTSCWTSTSRRARASVTPRPLPGPPTR